MVANTSHYSVAESKSALAENGCVYAATLFKGTPEQAHNIAVAVMTTAHAASTVHAHTFVTDCVQQMHVDRCHLCVCWLPGEPSRYEALFNKRDVAFVLNTFKDGGSVSTLPMYIAVMHRVDVHRRKHFAMRTLSQQERAFQSHFSASNSILDLAEKGGLDEKIRVCKDDPEASDPDACALSVFEVRHSPKFDVDGSIQMMLLIRNRRYGQEEQHTVPTAKSRWPQLRPQSPSQSLSAAGHRNRYATLPTCPQLFHHQFAQQLAWFNYYNSHYNYSQ